MHKVTKTYGADLGLSCAFRQWRASSHCRFLHGYSLSFTFVFEAEELDERNWVIDFGGLREIKGYLIDLFDHKTVVASDDPEILLFQSLEEMGLARLTILPKVGCEAFAELAFRTAETVLSTMAARDRVSVTSATCAEHAGNSATYEGER